MASSPAWRTRSLTFVKSFVCLCITRIRRWRGYLQYLNLLWCFTAALLLFVFWAVICWCPQCVIMYFSDFFKARGLKNLDFSEITSGFLRGSVRVLLKPQFCPAFIQKGKYLPVSQVEVIRIKGPWMGAWGKNVWQRDNLEIPSFLLFLNLVAAYFISASHAESLSPFSCLMDQQFSATLPQKKAKCENTWQQKNFLCS